MPSLSRGSVIAALLALTAACTGAPPSVAPSSSPAPSSTRMTREVDTIVQLECRATPRPIAELIPGATPSLRSNQPEGTTCLWLKDSDLSRHGVMIAVAPVDYRRYDLTLPGPKDVVEVPGAKGVSSEQLGYCSVLLDIDGRALDVQLHGIDDAGCERTQSVARQAVAHRFPRPNGSAGSNAESSDTNDDFVPDMAAGQHSSSGARGPASMLAAL